MIKTSKKHKMLIAIAVILILLGIAFLSKDDPSTTNAPTNTPENTGLIATIKTDLTPASSTATISSTSSASDTSNAPRVVIEDDVIPVDLAKTSAEVKKGLSGRLSLPADRGLLFFFSKPAIYQFWMPDMHFPIDIIWIDGGKIVDISASVSNDFDPENPIFYKPRQPAQYVLEVNAGFSAKHDINIGDTIIFENI